MRGGKFYPEGVKSTAPPKTRKAAPERRRRAIAIDDRLIEAYPDARCALDFTTPFELLVATVLSAQTTDVRVNQLTPELFGRWPTAARLAEANPADVEEVVRPLGMQRQRAKALVGLSAALVESDFSDDDVAAGRVPDDAQALEALPGVGRKTAHVVLGNAFGTPAITVDTHVARLAKRLGFTRGTTPLAIERSLAGLFPPERWTNLCHRLITHGREVCHARRPACGQCVLADLCPSAELSG